MGSSRSKEAVQAEVEVEPEALGPPGGRAAELLPRKREREVKLLLRGGAEGAWLHHTLAQHDGCGLFLPVSVGPGAVQEGSVGRGL